MHSRRVTYSVDEAAALVGLPRTTIYEAIRKGELRAAQFGRRIVIPATALEEMLGIQLPDGDPLGKIDEGINRVELAGTLVCTPTLRVSRRGVSYCILRVLLGRLADSDSLEVDIVAFGNRASVAAGLVENQPVRVEGHLAQREWQTADGVLRRFHRIVADRVQGLGAAPAESVASMSRADLTGH